MKKSNLDEMQEQKLLQIEHTCCWLAFWGLLTAIIIQVIIGGSLREIAGEAVVIFLLCGYQSFHTLGSGIWDRNLKPDLKTNLLASLVAGAAMGLISFFRFNGQMTDPSRLFITCLLSGITVFLLCFAVLSVTAVIQKKRRKTLDQE
ncbi:MAG: hypothetical protein IJ001_08620 [Oscillospiraceae bacterium]|nr:hypothetical protein [Oscillospiraceae bacterium]